MKKRLILQSITTYLIIFFAVVIFKENKNFYNIGYILLEAAIIAFIFVAMSLFLITIVNNSFEKLKKGASEFASGRLNYKISRSGLKEADEIAEIINKTMENIDEKISHIVQQSSEVEIILSNLAEGVIAVDKNGRIIKFNHAASKFTGIDPSDAQNKKIHQVIKNSELDSIILKALSAKDHIKEEIILENQGKEYVIRAYSTYLQDSQGSNIGALIVLNDITQLKKLENIRRDFIANVSHELKTPITSIKGYAETLTDGALENKEDAEKFTGIILNQANRLNSIIEDLLSLSRLEQDSQEGDLNLEESKVLDMIESAVQLCKVNAESKNINILFSCPEDITAMVNLSLMEQAVINLIDNAVKYSHENTQVQVKASAFNNEVMIKVVDQGQGISAEHLPRIFERFYRVDKARSRKLGGTGLGLSIVKHIAQIHGGYTTVESCVGKGSTFEIHIPARKSSFIKMS